MNIVKKIAGLVQTTPVFTHKNILQVTQELNACIGCNECLLACPAISSPLTIDRLNHETLSGFISPDVARFARSCYQCGACVEPCPVGLHRDSMMMLLKQRLLQAESEETMKTWNVNSRVEKGYPWLAFPQSESSRKAIIALLVAIVIGVLFTVGYLKTGLDPSPDSIVGYSYAFIGTGFALAALIAYTRKRRSHRRTVGQLNGALNWHVVFGLLALFFLLLHSFGNFNPRTGTYALYGMIALVISGIVGRTLDRILPRLAAIEVRRAMTAQGEDLADTISHQLEAISAQGVQQLGQSVRFSSLRSAYWLGNPNSVAEIIETHSLLREQTAEKIHALRQVEQSMAREHLYRYIIRYWRLFHKLLALVTVGLTIWHLVYAIQLLTGL